jgi:hypothetical protein
VKHTEAEPISAAVHSAAEHIIKIMLITCITLGKRYTITDRGMEALILVQAVAQSQSVRLLVQVR